MAIVTLPNIGGGSDPATINVSVLNGKVDPLATDYNGNIQNVNIASGAGIVYSKLSLTDSIVNADINSAAAIADTKLASITTSGKVALSALVVASQAQGDITYASSPTVWTRLGAGTNGQALTTGGASANPSWAGMTTAGDVEYHNGTTRTRLAKGTAFQLLRMNSGATAPEWASTAFSTTFTSTGQTITAGGSLTLAHSLGSAPSLIQCRLKCTSTDLGYAENDEVIINNHHEPGSSQGVSLVLDATNINVRYGSDGTSVFGLLNKGTGTNGNADNSKWVFIVKAWA